MNSCFYLQNSHNIHTRKTNLFHKTYVCHSLVWKLKNKCNASNRRVSSVHAIASNHVTPLTVTEFGFNLKSSDHSRVRIFFHFYLQFFTYFRWKYVKSRNVWEEVANNWNKRKIKVMNWRDADIIYKFIWKLHIELSIFKLIVNITQIVLIEEKLKLRRISDRIGIFSQFLLLIMPLSFVKHSFFHRCKLGFI